MTVELTAKSCKPCEGGAPAMTEEEILGIDRLGDVANCSVTAYRCDHDRLELEVYNFTDHLEAQDEPVTDEPDAPAAPR